MLDVFSSAFLSEYLGLSLVKPNCTNNNKIFEKTFLKIFVSIIFVSYYFYNLITSIILINAFGKFGDDKVDLIIMLFNIKFSILTMICIFYNHYRMKPKLIYWFRKCSNIDIKVTLTYKVNIHAKVRKKICTLVILTSAYYIFTFVMLFKGTMGSSLSFVITMYFPHILMNFGVIQYISIMYVLRKYFRIANHFLKCANILQKNDVVVRKINMTIILLITLRDLLQQSNKIYQVLNVLGVLKVFISSVYNAYYIIKIFWSWFRMIEEGALTMDIINWFAYTHFIELYTIYCAETCLLEVIYSINIILLY